MAYLFAYHASSKALNIFDQILNMFCNQPETHDVVVGSQTQQLCWDVVELCDLLSLCFGLSSATQYGQIIIFD